MAEKIISGDSLQNEFVAKFNGMVDEVNELKESGGSVELTKEAITDALGYTPSEEVRVTPKYTNGRNLAFIGIGNTGYNIYSPDAECITDVVELPDKEYMIDTSKIYRVAKVQSLVGGVKNQMPNPSTWLPDMLSGIPINIRHVETLPTAAVEPAYDNLDKPTRFVFYYLVTGEKLTDWSTDERIYAFLPAGTHLNTSTTYDVDTWVPVSAFLAHYMITDKGVITSESEATSSSHSSMYFLADIELYHYRNGWQKVSKGVTEEKVSEMIEEAVADIPSGGGGSTVSVTQTLTSGTKIGSITVDGKTTALYAPEGGGSGGGGGSIPADAIIDVDKLPEENAYLFKNGAKVEEYLMRKVVVYIVDTLPEVGELFLTSTSCNIYYQKGDDEAYCYLTPDVPPGGNFTGWAGLSSGFGLVSDFGYGGVITDESQATDTSRKYLVYRDGDINKNTFYATTEDEVYLLYNGIKNSLYGTEVTFHVVDILPETGEPFTDAMPPTRAIIYYQKSDNKCYGWGGLSWAEMSALGFTYNIISSDEEAVDGDTFYVVVANKRTLYWYNNGFEKVNTGAGLSIKQIIFTDRPTMWAWLQSNYSKILKTIVSASVAPIPLEFSTANTEWSSTGIHNVTFSSWYPHEVESDRLEFTMMYVRVHESGALALLSPRYIFLGTESSLDIGEGAPTTIPDEYWAQMSVPRLMVIPYSKSL